MENLIIMDKSTVLEIIKMLDQQADRYNPADNIYSSGRVDSYTELRDHLKSLIIKRTRK